MPVDRRLREGFRRNADSLDPNVDRFLGEVVRRSRRRVLVRRLASVTVVAALVVAAIVIGPRTLDALRGLRNGQPAHHGTWTPTPVQTSSSAASDPLPGTWQTSDITCQRWHAAATAAGFTEHQFRLVGCVPTKAHTQALRFTGVRMVGYEPNGTVGWLGTYEISNGDTIVADDGFDHITLRYSIEGDRLSLHLVQLTFDSPASHEQLVIERVLWTIVNVEPYTKQR
jgi:hypothetical protein